MTLNQIRYFVTVCQYQNFTKAAEKLHISQPGISKAMTELESECGTALFHRMHNSITLTPQGKALLEYARVFLEQYADFTAAAHSLSSMDSSLRIGMIPMCGSTIFPKLQTGFSNIWPDIRITTVEDSNYILYERLDRGEIDLALCVTNALPDADHAYCILKQSRLKLFVSHTHPLAAKHELSLQDLSGIPLVLFSDHYGQTRYIHRLFTEAGTMPQIVHQTTQVFTILEYIRSGAAAGFLSEEFAQEDPTIVPLTVREIPAANVYLVWKKKDDITPAMQKFTCFAGETFPESISVSPL
ncbi:MAG: LysR family transcriptional regulator [Lachnospiraceae bacterium]|jgi:DNA-binding transcriptional LysR family regulator